jgi:hypothetical protein
MTAAKFKPLVFPVLGFALSNISNILIIMILDDFCLLPAYFYYVIINVWKTFKDKYIYVLFLEK